MKLYFWLVNIWRLGWILAVWYDYYASYSIKTRMNRYFWRTAVWRARLMVLVMINLAQLWILSAAVEAAPAREFRQLLPLVISSGICWLIALSIFLWRKPASRRRTNAGYLRGK